MLFTFVSSFNHFTNSFFFLTKSNSVLTQLMFFLHYYQNTFGKKITIMKYLFSTLFLAAFFFIPKTSDIPAEEPTHIQVALLLDTSNSMDGLINQAKSQLWNILNTLSDAKIQGDEVNMEIALYHYGNSNNSIYNGYVKQLVPFTSDMDLISQELFKLTTSGGEEYCGEVIHQSLTQLEWKDKASLKMMYVAGNESFYQGNRNAPSVLAQCVEQGIIVNTIFCGDYRQGVSMKWRKGAEFGLGSYNVINQNEEIAYVETPFDDKIAALNIELNETYVSINTEGKKALKNMKDQDLNAATYGKANTVSRSIFKSKSNYNNASWDLVDSYEKDKSISYEKDELPADYRNLDEQELKGKIRELSEKRKSIQAQIKTYSKKRTNYIKNQSSSKVSGLEKVITTSVNSQLVAKGFTVESYTLDENSAVTPPVRVGYPNKQTYPQTNSVDIRGFVALTSEVATYRETRKIDIIEFYNFAKDPNTIILDTRSAKAFNESHLEGAINLNFSEFTEDKLASVIPSKDTRILIYCNNNFESEMLSLASKAAPLALNIPTFINLYGYGYKNIYELESQLPDTYQGLVIRK